MSSSCFPSLKCESTRGFPKAWVCHVSRGLTVHGFTTRRLYPGRCEWNSSSGSPDPIALYSLGSVEITIDAGSVSTGMKKRDDHLMSPDFLNAAEFPGITYKSTKVTINKDKTAMVEGNLTIMGVSKPVTLEVESINCGEHPMKKGTHICGFDAEGKFKRSDFGVTYALPAIGDEMKLHIEVEAKRN